MHKLIIIGSGGFGREVYNWASHCAANGRDWALGGFLDDNITALQGRRCPGLVICRVEDYNPEPQDLFVCAIGSPMVKRRCSETIAARGGQFINVFHPTAVVANEATFGLGVILCPYSVVSDNATVGSGVAVNLHATVDHDAQVGDWGQINCHCDLTGGVVLEEEVLVGSHATIMPGVRVRRGAVIGAGAVVMSDVGAGVTMAANPARPLRINQ